MLGLGNVGALGVRGCLPSLGQLSQATLCRRRLCFPWLRAPGAACELELQFQGDKDRRRHPGLVSQGWAVPGPLFLTWERLQVPVFFSKNWWYATWAPQWPESIRRTILWGKKLLPCDSHKTVGCVRVSKFPCLSHYYTCLYTCSSYLRMCMSLCPCVCVPVCVICWEGEEGRVCIASCVCELVVCLPVYICMYICILCLGVCFWYMFAFVSKPIYIFFFYIQKAFYV